MKHRLTLAEAIAMPGSPELQVLEGVQRWLLPRRGLSVEFSLPCDVEGRLHAACAISYHGARYISWDRFTRKPLPYDLSGTFSALCDVDREPWPLAKALARAARMLENAERRVLGSTE